MHIAYYQGLWRVKCKECANKSLKQTAYQDLVELWKTVLRECNVDYVKKKIVFMRVNFQREHKKVNICKKSGIGART